MYFLPQRKKNSRQTGNIEVRGDQRISPSLSLKIIMKKYITIKQWDEISFDDKNNFKHYPISIGDMLEFLGDDFISLHIDDDVFFVDTTDTSFYGEEPTIPLWEAVKFKLRE